MKEHPILSTLPGKSPSTLRFWNSVIPKGDWDLLQFGEKKHYQSSYAGSRIPAEMPGDLIQIDFGVLDVWTRNDATGERVQPYLLAAIDVRTRAYVGAVLTLHHPTIADTLMLLKTVLLPKPNSMEQLLCNPKVVQFDNGTIFNNPEVKKALLELNIVPQPIEVERPTSNAVVERGFRLIKDEFSSLFVRHVVDRRTWGGVQDVPTVYFSGLHEDLDEWMLNYNYVRPHSFHGKATPAKVWRDLTKGSYIALDHDAVKKAMSYPVECRVNKNGAVEPYKGQSFHAEQTWNMVGQKIEVRVTPDRDPNHVYGYIGNDWVKLESIYAQSGLAQRFAAGRDNYKGGVMVLREAFEDLVEMPRIRRDSERKRFVKPPKTTPITLPKKTAKAPLSVGKATAIQNQTFTLV